MNNNLTIQLSLQDRQLLVDALSYRIDDLTYQNQNQFNAMVELRARLNGTLVPEETIQHA